MHSNLIKRFTTLLLVGSTLSLIGCGNNSEHARMTELYQQALSDNSLLQQNNKELKNKIENIKKETSEQKLQYDKDLATQEQKAELRFEKLRKRFYRTNSQLSKAEKQLSEQQIQFDAELSKQQKQAERSLEKLRKRFYRTAQQLNKVEKEFSEQSGKATIIKTQFETKLADIQAKQADTLNRQLETELAKQQQKAALTLEKLRKRFYRTMSQLSKAEKELAEQQQKNSSIIETLSKNHGEAVNIKMQYEQQLSSLNNIIKELGDYNSLGSREN